jgi:hypothetical protein
MSRTDIVTRLNRLKYAVEAVDNVHGGDECPEEDVCERCADKSIAMADQLQTFPWLFRMFMYACTPISSWHFMQDVKFFRERKFANGTGWEAIRAGRADDRDGRSDPS